MPGLFHRDPHPQQRRRFVPISSPAGGVTTVALVVADKASLTAGDIVIRDRLVALGYTNTLVSDEDAAELTKDLVVICESVAGGTIAAKYKNASMPVVLFEGGIVDDMDFASVGAAGNAGQTQITILDDTHDLAAGQTGTVTYTASASMLTNGASSELGAGVENVAHLVGNSNNVSIYAYDTGAAMRNAHNAEARRVFVGLAGDASAAGLLDATGISFIDAAFLWAKPLNVGGGTTVTPITAALTLTAFAPTVTATANQSVTPGVASLTLTAFAPSVAVGINVVPTTASLTLTAFAPTVAVSDNKLVTPGVASLTLTTFAPTVAAPRLVTPTTAALTITGFAPTVSTTAHVTVVPGAAALTLSTFAPSVQAGAGLTVVPGPASLVLTAFAPTVTGSANQTVTPTTAALTLTGFAPVVSATDHRVVVPLTASLLLTLFAPTVAATGQPVVGGTGPGVYGVLVGRPGGVAVMDRPRGHAVNSTPGSSALNPKPE